MCRLEPCTWQSFGTRAGSSTPHAFEARKLLLKLSTDPAVVAIRKNPNPSPNPNPNPSPNPTPNPNPSPRPGQVLRGAGAEAAWVLLFNKGREDEGMYTLQVRGKGRG